MCFVCISETSATLPYITLTSFVTEKKIVYYAVRAKSLNEIDYPSVLKGLRKYLF
jgi:hypothetical protein